MSEHKNEKENSLFFFYLTKNHQSAGYLQYGTQYTGSNATLLTPRPKIAA